MDIFTFFDMTFDMSVVVSGCRILSNESVMIMGLLL